MRGKSTFRADIRREGEEYVVTIFRSSDGRIVEEMATATVAGRQDAHDVASDMMDHEISRWNALTRHSR